MSEINFDEIEPETVILDSEVPNWKACKPEKETLRERVRRGATAPSKERAEARRTSTPKTPTAKRGAFVTELTELYTYAGMGLMMVDEPCGTAVVSSAEQCAKSLDELAYTNPAVRRALTSLTQTSAIGAVVMAHFPILMAVASHHGGALMRTASNKKENNEPVPATEI